MKALVTGAAGFVGSTLCDTLLAAGHEVVGIDCFIDYYPRELKERNLTAALANPRFRFVEASLVNAPLADLLRGIDVVYHQAAQAGVRASWGDDFRIYSDNNVFATQRLLEACRAASLAKFVYASSSSIYGDTDDLPMRETSRPQPVSPYGVTKLAAEHLTWLYWKNYGLPTVSLRYFTVYGPRQRPDLAIHKFTRKLLAGEPLPVYGDGTTSRDYTYIDDIVDGVIRALEWTASAEPRYGIFNLGESRPVELRRLVEVLERATGTMAQRQQLPMQAGDVERTYADLALSTAILGYRPSTDIEEGIDHFVKWYRAQQLGEGDF